MFSALLDACVLVPSALRDVLLEIGSTQAYRPLWSEKIEIEMERAILRVHASRGRDREESYGYVTRLRRQMNAALPDAQVRGWEDALPAISEMRDANDKHVVAAALIGRADVVVTFNLKDFENRCLPGALSSQSPDDFLLDLIGLYPRLVLSSLNTIVSRTGRKGPAWTVNDLLERLEVEGVREFIKVARNEM
ncbi:PIN domain-containing protein [Actinomyces israelii]|uniref:PIN domain-containing protein n=1 Tax=Actinomyces israelii TaxID=1659 RepID=A0ABT4I7F1_9ACTO|nr:PIN domain-containing protein [Actinomyces israelii]MCZ0857217.1 PIN domain-containing protein [Actinomyces israelii]